MEASSEPRKLYHPGSAESFLIHDVFDVCETPIFGIDDLVDILSAEFGICFEEATKIIDHLLDSDVLYCSEDGNVTLI